MVIHLFGASVEHIKSESLRGVFYIDDAFRLVTYNIHSGDKRPIDCAYCNYEKFRNRCVRKQTKKIVLLSFSLFDHSELTNKHFFMISLGTRSRTLSLPQISKDQELKRNITKNEGPEYPKMAHGRHQDSAGQKNEGLQCPDDFAEGVVLEFGDDGNSFSQNEFTSRETNSSYLSNEFLL